MILIEYGNNVNLKLTRSYKSGSVNTINRLAVLLTVS